MNTLSILIFSMSCCAPLFLMSEPSNAQVELSTIEQQIHILETRLQRDRLLELREEVKGQGLMLADWQAYGDAIEKIRQLEEEERQIEKQINALQQQKAQLLKNRDSNNFTQ